jgi:hypothetical protein
MRAFTIEILTRLDVVFSAATALMAFSLLAYLFVQNFRNAVGRSFVTMLSAVTVVFVGDVFLATARMPAGSWAADLWLRVQWLGIAFVPATYLLFSDALLVATGDVSRRRRITVAASFGIGAAVVAAVAMGDTLVGGAAGSAGAVHLLPGPWFGPFAAAYWLVAGQAAWNVWRARSRAMTARSRRRFSYLLVSVAVPVATFPYLVAGAGRVPDAPLTFRLAVVAANVAIASALVIVAYAVAYQGVLAPERQVKRELVKYLVQGPTLGAFVIFLTQAVPERLEGHLGLPRDVVLTLTLMVGIVSYQLFVRALKPLVDQLIYGGESEDAMWVRRLDEQLLTREDLEQLLENILTALCDRLRVRTGFVVVMRSGRLELDATTGSQEKAAHFIRRLGHETVTQVSDQKGFAAVNGFWVHRLQPPGGGATLGLLAIENPQRPLRDEERRVLSDYVASTERALEDRVIQGRVLDALKDLQPELEGLQRLRGALERGGDTSIGTIETNPIYAPDFSNWVKDALSHYWGGPKLTESPLLGLKIVASALEENDHNAAKAMRAVLDSALERMKPNSERSMTAYEWLAYNIVELKFVRGLKVRDIASRLAMSESDLYRKQRVAIEALAQQLVSMEADPTSGAGPTDPETSPSVRQPPPDRPPGARPKPVGGRAEPLRGPTTQR